MSNGQEPAFPANFEITGNASGLTKLELFAAMAMHGICSDPRRGGSLDGRAAEAVNAAKALISALEKEQVRT